MNISPEGWKRINIALSIFTFVFELFPARNLNTGEPVPFWVCAIVFPAAFIGVSFYLAGDAKGKTLDGVWSVNPFNFVKNKIAFYFFGSFLSMLAGAGGICASIWKGEAELKGMLGVFCMGLGGVLGVWFVSSRHRKENLRIKNAPARA